MNDVIRLDNTVKRFANSNVGRKSNIKYQVGLHILSIKKNGKRLINYGLLIVDVMFDFLYSLLDNLVVGRLL